MAAQKPQKPRYPDSFPANRLKKRRKPGEGLFDDPWKPDTALFIQPAEPRDDSIYLDAAAEDIDSLQTFLPVSQAVRRRSAFSASAAGLLRYEISEITMGAGHTGGRHSSSQLLDDLINHPMDQMYDDSMLTAKRTGKAGTWVMRALSFILCVVIGVVGTQAVKLLQRNTRAKVRGTLSAQVSNANDHQKKLLAEVTAAQQRLNKLTESVDNFELSQRQKEDNFSAALTKIEGPGLRIVITNPSSDASADDQGGSRTSAGQAKQSLTDEQMQIIISRLWAYKADGIAVNGIRLGLQSSIRLAGNNILIGTTPITSPYTIEAIGNAHELPAAVDAEHNPRFNEMLRKYGISVTISSQRSLTLPAAGMVKINYAKEK